MSQPTLRQRTQGLAATLAILLLVVGLPFVLVAIGATPWNEKLTELRDVLTSPDDGTLALLVFAIVAWISWAVMVVSVLVEAVARIRGLPAPSLPGFALPQRAAGQLITVAALLFAAAPTIVATFPASPAVATEPLHEATRLASFETAPAPPEAAPALSGTDPQTRHRPTVDYTVKRGDSLWKIADRLLGDGARFPEIVDLNSSVLNGRPDFIISGTVLKVPSEATDNKADHNAEEYIVRPGDTLSEIAESTLGDPARYPELFDASRRTVQQDGVRLTNPNLIRPGWDITIPGPAKHKAGAPNHPAQVPPPSDVEPPAHTPTNTPTESPTPSAQPTPTRSASANPESKAPANHTDSDVEAPTPGWLVPGLTGAGAILAGLLLLAVRAHRHTQLRYRHPGQTIAPPPPELRAVEKTAFVSGAALTTTIEQLDRALLHLAGICQDERRALPSLVTAMLTGGAIALHFSEDADLPEPWVGTCGKWSMRLGEPLPVRNDVIPPYPLLVTVGQDDAGALHLVNLEHLGVVSLGGDSAAATALARHMAAELALNPWSVLVDVNVIGFGEELATLDPFRLHHHTDGDQVIGSLTQNLAEAHESGWGDPDPFLALITTGEGNSELAGLLASPNPRLGAALVSLAEPVPESTAINVDAAGRLHAPSLGLDLRAAGLTSEEAAACAAIVDLTRDSEPVRIAPFAQAADGWRSLADQAGSLREELTDVRAMSPAGRSSLLPNSTEEYTELAAATAEDVETLAPVVPDRIRQTVEDVDPLLDADVADWFEPGRTRPRLTLLGPVQARAFGVIAPVITKRRPYFVEILAYLALHPEGVTGSAVAEAFSIAASRARTDVSTLRDWLGTNPRTGGPYLPAANESPSYRETGVKTYQVQDVLVDLDLFRRLRARGEARGVEGINDLKTAMSLVEGEPFSLLREKGWSWLLDTERVHETTGCAIVDTAHILVVDALAKGDLAFARETAEMACKAAPYDDICRLDLVKVAAAEGHHDAADKMLADHVFNRTDDYLPPIDLPARTGEVVGKQGWGNAKRRPSA